MKWPGKFATHAQFNEDIILAALFSNKKKGFYVDVGANDEEYHSVTKYFYKLGWSGINIEPIPRLFKEFEKKRKRDTNLNYAVSSKAGFLKFREYPNHDGLSTFSEKSKRENEALDIPYEDYEVRVDTLTNIFQKFDVKEVDFLKIDVEGYEEEVIKSNDWDRYRPKVVCIEANHRSTNWQAIIKRHNYERVIFDGLNEYYVAKEHKGLLSGFAERAAVLAHNAIRKHHQVDAQKEIKILKTKVDEQEKEIVRLRAIEHQLKSLKFLTKHELNELARRMKIKGRS